MKTLAGRLVLALVFLVAAAACLAEARLSRRAGVVYERLATLRFDVTDLDEATGRLTRFPSAWSVSHDIQKHQATAAYWRGRYDDLTTARPDSEAGAADPELLFAATNAAFRSTQLASDDRATAVERLDRVIQGYADVLRAAPSHDDAAYNYEYVVRLRDAVARRRSPVRAAKDQSPPGDTAVDLPVGPTIHGRPGGPPPEASGDQFRMLIPMDLREREEGAAGKGPVPRRRG